MNSGDIHTLLRKLGCTRIKEQPTKGWVNASCPFAPYKHAEGRDEHPSFGVSISPEGRSIYRCFTCGRKGEMNALLWGLQAAMKDRGRTFPGDINALMSWVKARNEPNPAEMRSRLQRTTLPYQGLKELGGIEVSPSLVMRNVDGTEAEPAPLPETDLDVFVKPDGLVLEYLKTARGFTQETIDRWELGWQERAKRIGIPIRDVKRRLVGVSGRAIDPKAKPKFLHSKGFHRDFYLYGEHLCQTGVAGFLTEGFFDVMKLHQQGWNAFAIMGSYLSPLQKEKCLRFFSEVVIFTDGDRAGYESAERIVRDLSGKTKVRVAVCPEGMDPDDLDLDTLVKLLGPPNLVDNASRTS